MELAAGVFLVVAVTVGAIALSVMAWFWRAWAIVTLWGWFAVPIFHFPAISYAQALAVTLLVHMMTYQYVPSKEKDWMMPLSIQFLGPPLAVFIGWVLKSYV